MDHRRVVSQSLGRAYGDPVQVDDAWKSLSQVNEWIRFADAKAFAVLAGSGVLGSFLVGTIPHLKDFRVFPVRAALLSIAITCVGISALIALRCVAPRLHMGEDRSLIYFSHVAQGYSDDRGDFVKSYLSLATNESKLGEIIVEQVWANSLVARRKFRRVAYSVTFLGLAMVSSGLAVIGQRVLGI
jgi:hypothetical protein